MTDLSFLQNSPNFYKKGLYNRSQGIAASRFNWDNPVLADGIPILARWKETDIDPNIKVDHNLFEQIMQEKSSYIASNIEIVFGQEIPEDVKEKYEDLEKHYFLKTVLKSLMEDCSGWGNSYMLCYLDQINQAAVKKIYSWNAYINEDTGNGYVIERLKNIKNELTDRVKIYEYDNTHCYVYNTNSSLENLSNITPDEEYVHGFGLMPLVEFSNNENNRGNAEKAVSLIDAYDRTVSDNLTEEGSLRQAYLLLKDMGNLDTAMAKEFKRLAMLIGNNENSDAKFLTKNINPDFVRFVTERTWSSIWSTSCCPDPNVLESLSNVTAFQISQIFRRLDNNCQYTVSQWQKSLQQFDDILHSFWTGLDLNPVRDYNTYKIDYKFNKNIPIDVMTYLKNIREAGGNLPQEEIFIKAGYGQDEAISLAQKYNKEQNSKGETT